MGTPLQAQYDAREDRMRLTLHPAAAEPRSFWVTRRQWLELLHALAALPLPDAVEPASESSVPVGARKARALEVPPATPVREIRLRRTPAGARLAFVAGPEGATLALPPAGVRRLILMLQQQADRAGWDPQAALARLNARDLAGATVSKARRLH